jgi:hypothetical protein
VPGRTLVSAALAASIGAALLSTLALYLNPGLVLRVEAPAILLCLFLPWTLAGTLLLALVAAAASALGARHAFPPLLRKLPFFVSLTFVALSLAALLYWSNLLAYRDALPAEVLRALALSATVVTSAAAVLVAVVLHTLFFPGRERSAAVALAILAPTLAVAAPLALRPDIRPPAPVIPVRLEAAPSARRIVVVGIDGLRASDLTGEPSSSPVLSRLARRGALASLRTLHPNEGPPLWTTLLTGRYPRDHGVLSATTYELTGSKSEWHLLPKGAGVGLLERARLARRLPVSSSARKRRAIWNVLDAFGMPTGLVRVWGTQPPEAIQRPSRRIRTVRPAGAVSGTVSESVSSRPSPFGVMAGEARAMRPSVRVSTTGTSAAAVRPPVAFAVTWTTYAPSGRLRPSKTMVRAPARRHCFGSSSATVVPLASMTVTSTFAFAPIAYEIVVVSSCPSPLGLRFEVDLFNRRSIAGATASDRSVRPTGTHCTTILAVIFGWMEQK